VKNIIVVSNLYPSKDRPYFGTFVKNSVRTLEDNGWDVTVFALPFYGRGFLGYLKFYAATFIHLLSFNGIVYVHYISHSVLPVLLSLVFNRNAKIVLHYHGSDAFSGINESITRVFFKRKICQIANVFAIKFISPSQLFAQRLQKKFGIPEKSLFVSPSGGVNTRTFFPPQANQQNNKNSVRCLFVSRMIPGKGAKEVALIIQQLLTKKGAPQIEATLIGSGPEQADVKEALALYIEQDKCRIIDASSQAEIAAEFRKTDIFLFPSFREGESLGLVLIEAIFCGAIPLVIDCGAVREVLPNNTHTSLIAPDIKQYENALTNLINLLQDNNNKCRLQEQLKQITPIYEEKNVALALSNLMQEIEDTHAG
jgi:glycosyltransferase involved in cell wall biosynthesis